MRWLITLLITYYQRFISSYKGFHCAYLIALGGISCSQAVKRIVQVHGPVKGVHLIRAKFQACRGVYQILSQ